MGPIFLAVVLFLIHALVPLPYPIDLIVYIAAFIALVYGLYVLFVGWRGPPADRTGRRYWY